MPINKLFYIKQINKILLYTYNSVLYQTDKQNTAIFVNLHKISQYGWAGTRPISL